MQHQLSYSNASTTINPVKPSPIGNRASVRLARLAETEAPCATQFKKTLDIANAGRTKASTLGELKWHCEPPRKDPLLKLHLEPGVATRVFLRFLPQRRLSMDNLSGNHASLRLQALR